MQRMPANVAFDIVQHGTHISFGPMSIFAGDLLNPPVTAGPPEAARALTSAPRLPEGTVVEILDGAEWIRGIVDASGVVVVIADPLRAACNGWQLPIDVVGDAEGLGRRWRYCA